MPPTRWLLHPRRRYKVCAGSDWPRPDRLLSVVVSVLIAVVRPGQRDRQAVAGGVAQAVEVELGHRPAQRLARAYQPDPDRARGGLEHLGELAGVELVPVVQLEQQLLIGGQG